MKSMIAMMNAKKFYEATQLVHHREAMQEKLSADISLPAYQKLVSTIQGKNTLNRL